MASSSSSTKAEYQHFVPQFLLKNFAKKYQPSKDEFRQSNKQKRGKSTKIYPGELVVHHIDLNADTLAIEVVKVKRVMGMNDMYQDIFQATVKQQHHIEELFSKLEGRSAPILRKVIKAFEAGKCEIWLSREERNEIRKFLFLLKYRGSQFHQRFYAKAAEEYDADDKDDLLEYMRENNLRRPVDVWFQGIEAIAQCQMDAAGDWMSTMPTVMYPPDARWFISHTQQSYMAFCFPSAADTEFILTDNSYNIYEGINSVLGPWVNFHDFAPVSPKLLIVLRSFILPVTGEETDGIREKRKLWRTIAVDRVFGPGKTSELADLPITKATNNYTRMVGNQLQLLEENWSASKRDQFHFKFFPVATDHMNKLNSFFLDNVRSSIVLASSKSFTKALEWYMADTSRTWKNIVGSVTDKASKVAKLEKLTVLMKALGSVAIPFWYNFPELQGQELSFTGLGPTMTLQSEFQRILDERLDDTIQQGARDLPLVPTPLMDLYSKLGTSLSKFPQAT